MRLSDREGLHRYLSLYAKQYTLLLSVPEHVPYLSKYPLFVRTHEEILVLIVMKCCVGISGSIYIEEGYPSVGKPQIDIPPNNCYFLSHPMFPQFPTRRNIIPMGQKAVCTTDANTERSGSDTLFINLTDGWVPSSSDQFNLKLFGRLASQVTQVYQ